MKKILGLFFGAFCACLMLATILAAPSNSSPSQPSAAYQWLDVALEATANDVNRYGARPTVLSRTLAMAETAAYDAWAAFDDTAVGTLFGGKLRQPSAKLTLKNKIKAISYAEYRTLLDVYPEDKELLTKYMKSLGFDPNDISTDTTTPQGIGNTVAIELIKQRHSDGSNQLGNEVGGSGKSYSDYTHYTPVNSAEQINNPDRWQPIQFTTPKGVVTPNFLTPHWYRVKPFALERPDQFRPSLPPLVGSDQLLKEVEEVIDYNANLTPQYKAIVEFMRDGPGSTGQSGHWLKFAQVVSQQHQYNLDQDVKLFFAVSNAAMDAFIAAWDAKRVYDSSRPWTLVHHYFNGKEIKAWGGPGKGAVTIMGENWYPYSPVSFITPPFPGFVSGHSTVSAACAEILRLFTGSDQFNYSETIQAGSLTEPGYEREITLNMPTFTATAEMAGISRVMGGYHIQSDNIRGLELGKAVAAVVWSKFQNLEIGKS